jgi:uncharacterized membrane protein YbhN (UPF0104 family)
VTASTKRIALRVAISVFVALVVVFFGVAVVKAWQATHGEIPSVWWVLATAGLWTVGLLALASAWVTLLGGDQRLVHGAAALVSQLGKYVPGGVWQATGQVGIARSAGVSLKRAAVGFSVLAVVQAISGFVFAVPLAFAWSGVPVVVRAALALGGVASLALVDRRWMVWLLHKIPRTRDASSQLVPAQRPIVLAFGWCFVTLLCGGVAYLVLLSSLGEVSNPTLVVAAYAAAWTIGFIAVPVPAGVGIREAVLLTILHGTFPASVIVAASVYQRLVSVATEGALAAASSHQLRPARIRAGAVADAALPGEIPGDIRGHDAE